MSEETLTPFLIGKENFVRLQVTLVRRLITCVYETHAFISFLHRESINSPHCPRKDVHFRQDRRVAVAKTEIARGCRSSVLIDSDR